MPHPRLVLKDAMFDLRSSWREWIVVYMGLPSIGGTVEFSEISIKLLTDVAAIWGGGGRGVIRN